MIMMITTMTMMSTSLPMTGLSFARSVSFILKNIWDKNPSEIQTIKSNLHVHLC